MSSSLITSIFLLNVYHSRQSLFREYSGSYLESLGAKRCNEIKDAMFRIIDFYSKTERVKFVDHQAFQIVRNSGQAPMKEARLLALTDSAIYVLEILDKMGQYKYHRQKPIPIVILRRRISFLPSADPARGTLQHCQLTKFADGLVLLAMKPTGKIEDPKTVAHPDWPVCYPYVPLRILYVPR